MTEQFRRKVTRSNGNCQIYERDNKYFVGTKSEGVLYRLEVKKDKAYELAANHNDAAVFDSVRKIIEKARMDNDKNLIKSKG